MTVTAAYKSIGRTLGHSHLRRFGLLAAVTALGLMMTSNGKVGAQTTYPDEWLCDNQFQDCREPIRQLIAQETVGIDVSYWFLIDYRYKDWLIAAKKRGVQIRVIVDTQADGYAVNKTYRNEMIAAGIPFRDKTTQGINHWKMMLYAGQKKVHFTAANFAQGSYSPSTKYQKYVDEAIYFTDDRAVVDTFMRKFDDLWTDTVNFTNLANISGTLTRNYPTSSLQAPDARLNFPPDQDYQDRVVSNMKLETQAIDVIIFRVTSAKIPDELLRRHQAGVPIRFITDKDQYRNPTYFWHSYNIDRLYAAGQADPAHPIQIKWRRDDVNSDEDMHQKSLVLHSRNMAIFGSSNWTSSSSDTQREHNIFMNGSGTLAKPWFVEWFKDQFERRWNNRKAADESPGAIGGLGAPLDLAMYLDFTPLYPEAPVISSPANGALGVTSPVLKWEGGWWAHKYDIYFGTTNPPPLIAQDFVSGSASAGVSSTKESFNPCAPPAPFESVCPSGLAAGTTYYWRIRGKTMAGLGVISPTSSAWSFSTPVNGAEVPLAPTGLTGTAVSSSRIDLSWNNVANETGYKIERKLSSATTWTQIATTPADATTYQDQSGIAAGTTYNYRVRAYNTSAGNSGYSNTITVTAGALTLSSTDVVLYASKAPVRVGAWSPVADSTAAGGNRMNNPNAGAAMVSTPLANPANYFEMTFTAPAGQGFRLWIRGKAASNNGNNDSAHVQFSDSVTSGGSPVYRIGTTSGTYVNLAEVSGAALQDWGWQDNGFGAGVFGPLIYFANSGTHTIRVQVREDGFSIDQIVLSRDTFLNAAPGANKADNTKLTEQNGGGSTPPSAPDGLRIVADAYVRGGTFASTNFGSATEMITKFSTDGNYHREAYMKLDISDWRAGDTATLRLTGHLSDTRATGVTARIFAVSSTSWDEKTLNYNNRPASGTSPIGTVVVSGTAKKAYDVDLTSHVQAQFNAGARTISIALKNPIDTLPYSAFSSRESATKPLLLFQ